MAGRIAVTNVEKDVRNYLHYVPTQERFEELMAADDEFYAPYSVISLRLPCPLSMNHCTV